MGFKTSIQRELDSFFKATSNSEFNIREVTKGAFTQARSKLKPEGFKRLNEIAVNTFYDEAPYYKWFDFRVLAIDGTRLVLPNHHTVVEEFGQHKFGPKADSPRSLALGSVLYDVLNQVAIDAQIDRYDSSERDLLMKHLEFVKKGDLLLLDRGYPCFWLLFLLIAKEIGFCVRLKDNWWVEVNEFVKSTDNERIVKFKLPKKDRDKLSEFPQIINTEIECRLIKVVLDTGEIEVLCTSLTDLEKYPIDDFKELYHYRWNEEEVYKLLKRRVELEQFSGKTAIAVKQDFYAKVFLLTLCATYAHPIEDLVIKEYKADEERKFSQKINRTAAIDMTQKILIGVFIKKQFKKAIKAFDEIIYRTRELIRPNRSVPRKHGPKKNYSMNYKRL
jgi:Transposase DDE domain